MTLNEFRCWLDGFSESITEAPTPVQWKRILEALAKVGDGGTVLKLPASPFDQRGIGVGTADPIIPWAKSICQNQAAVEADRQRRINNNQTVEVR